MSTAASRDRTVTWLIVLGLWMLIGTGIWAALRLDVVQPTILPIAALTAAAAALVTGIVMTVHRLRRVHAVLTGASTASSSRGVETRPSRA